MNLKLNYWLFRNTEEQYRCCILSLHDILVSCHNCCSQKYKQTTINYKNVKLYPVEFATKTKESYLMVCFLLQFNTMEDE